MKKFNKYVLALGLLSSFSATYINAAPAFDYSKASTNYVDNSSNGDGFDNPYYFGATIGPSEGKNYCNGAASCEDADTAWKLFGGYKLSDVFSVEGAYMNLGDMHKTGSNSDVSALTVHGVASLPITDQVDLFGKLGAARWSSDNTGSSKSGLAFAYGLGAKIGLSETTKLRAEWEKVPGVETSATDKTDVTMMSVGVELSTY